MKHYFTEIKFSRRFTGKIVTTDEVEDEGIDLKPNMGTIAASKAGRKLNEKYPEGWMIHHELLTSEMYMFMIKNVPYKIQIQGGDISFRRIGSDVSRGFGEITGAGAFKVMPFVAAAVKHYAKKHGEKVFSFTPEKQKGEESKTGNKTARGKMYIDLIQSYIPSADVYLGGDPDAPETELGELGNDFNNNDVIFKI